jgi:hypothetical protein
MRLLRRRHRAGGLMAFRAKYCGECPRCLVGYSAGTPIRHHETGWIHVFCPSPLTHRSRDKLFVSTDPDDALATPGWAR